MADRIYVTYTPTGVPGSFHTAIHYQRTGQHGDVIEHLIIEAGPENKDLSPPEKIIGAIEEAMREGDEPSRFGSIQAKIRERRAADLTEAASDDPNAPYEVIAEANDLSENVARMQLYALGFNLQVSPIVAIVKTAIPLQVRPCRRANFRRRPE
jgi:hypothetical protein